MIEYHLEKVILDQDLDKIVVETYNKPFCFQQQADCRERQRILISIPMLPEEDFTNTMEEVDLYGPMGVSFSTWLSRDPPPGWAELPDIDTRILWWHRNFYPDLSMIINDLHKKGLIEAGEYVIDVDW